ncbi:MAG: ATP synthase subunit I [Cyanobacteriota bacterium]
MRGERQFGALWLTVRQLPHSRHPTLLLLGSGLARLGLATVGFYLLFGGEWVGLGLALLGFVLARMVLIARWQPQDSGLDPLPNTLKDSLSNNRSGEVSHEH